MRIIDFTNSTSIKASMKTKSDIVRRTIALQTGHLTSGKMPTLFPEEGNNQCPYCKFIPFYGACINCNYKDKPQLY